MCRLINPDLRDPHDFYRYLVRFGMYKPTRGSNSIVEKFENRDVWGIMNRLYKKYRSKWKGPNVDIYIFPIDHTNPFFMNDLKGRSGLSFKEQIFFFLSSDLNKNEIEAIFVHEYHHASRMTKYPKNPENYNLLDSVIFEGLAELAVISHCGKDYAAFWTKQMSTDEINNIIKNIYLPNFSITRKRSLHDQLLFGGIRGLPPLMGYTAGFEIAKTFIKGNPLTVNDSFSISSDKILTSYQAKHSN